MTPAGPRRNAADYARNSSAQRQWAEELIEEVDAYARRQTAGR